MNKYIERVARLIPQDIRDSILDEKFIDIAINSEVENSPMQYLFDVYEYFIDKNGEFNDWTCSLCRGHILNSWKEMKPFLETLRQENENS